MLLEEVEIDPGRKIEKQTLWCPTATLIQIKEAAVRADTLIVGRMKLFSETGFATSIELGRSKLGPCRRRRCHANGGDQYDPGVAAHADGIAKDRRLVPPLQPPLPTLLAPR